MPSYLKLDHVGKTFQRGSQTTEVLRDIQLEIERGEYVSIIGHSGCGKSTLLNLVAGLTPVTTGAVLLENFEVNAPGPERAVVFQNHSLLPWLTVYENVKLAVDKVFSATKSKAERHDWIMHNLDLVQMAHAKDKRPSEISGGMKQRVGIARALAMEPKILLLDEPFGALDALTRAHLQDSVMDIHARLGNTIVMITHDVDEAVLLSDRIVMMTNGPAATIGEVLSVDLPRPRKRLELVGDSRVPQRAARPCSSSSTSATASSKRHERGRDEGEARHHRQRHGAGPGARAAVRDRARPLRGHDLQRRAAGQLRPHHALAGALRREELRRHRHPRRRLVHRARHHALQGLQGRGDRPRERRSCTRSTASPRPTTSW